MEQEKFESIDIELELAAENFESSLDNDKSSIPMKIYRIYKGSNAR